MATTRCSGTPWASALYRRCIRSDRPWIDDPSLNFVEPSSRVLALDRVLVERAAVRAPDQDHPSIGVRPDLGDMAEVAVLIIGAVLATEGDARRVEIVVFGYPLILGVSPDLRRIANDEVVSHTCQAATVTN